MNNHQRNILQQRQGDRIALRSRSNNHASQRPPPYLSNAMESFSRSTGVAAVNHNKRLMKSYNDMSQISQLSMDSSFGNSLSTNTNFVDNNNIPLRQPSASITSRSSSSSTTGQHRYNNLYEQRKNLASSFDFNTSSGRNSNYNRSNGELKMKSSLQKNKKFLRQKTRFASTSPGTMGNGETSVGSNLSSSQRSRSTRSSSFSASALKSSNASYYGSNNECQESRSHQQGNSKAITLNTNRQNTGKYLTRSQSGVNNYNAILTNFSRNKKRSSSTTSFQDPIFAKAATPQKGCIVPYPPVNSEKKHRTDLRHHYQQHQQHHHQQQQVNKNYDMKKDAPIPLTKQTGDPYVSRHDEKVDIDIDIDNINTRGTGSTCTNINQYNNHHDKENQDGLHLDVAKGVTDVNPATNSTPTSTGKEISGRFPNQQTDIASTNEETSINLVSVEQKHQTLQQEIEVLEKKKQDMKDFETRLIMDVQKQLEKEKLDLLTKMESDAVALEEKTTQKLSRECEAIASAVEGRLNQKAASIQEATLLKIDQKRDENEKKINDTASIVLKEVGAKLEVSLDSGLAKFSNLTSKAMKVSVDKEFTKISKYAERLVANIKPLMDKSVSSLSSSMLSSSSNAAMALSSGKAITRKRDSSVIALVSNEKQPKRKRTKSVDDLPISEKVCITTSRKRKEKTDKSSSSSVSFIFEGEVSVTQGSRQSGIDKASSAQLRKSKDGSKNSLSPSNHPLPEKKGKRGGKQVDTNKKSKNDMHRYKKKKQSIRTMITPPGRISQTGIRSRRKKKATSNNETTKTKGAPSKILAEIETTKVQGAPATDKSSKANAPKKFRVPSEIVTKSARTPSPLRDSFRNKTITRLTGKKKKSYAKRKSTNTSH